MSEIISLGLWIKRRRKSLDLTQDELARRASCSLETIRKIEGDARRPSRELAALLAEKLELAVDERVAFIQAARAELGADRLAPPTQSIARGAFVIAQAVPSAADAPEPRPPTPPTNLLTPPTALIGREHEIAQICALLRRADNRLLTLTGSGGIGKTRLSLQIAAELGEEFPEGVYFVDLAPTRDPELVIGQIATTLDLKGIGGQPLLATLIKYLRDKHILLILDNFEQVIGAAPSVADLLANTVQIKVLVTSREILHVRGEQEVAVPPLALPPADDGRRTTDDQHGDVVSRQWSVVGQYAAVALFIERAQAVKADFALTKSNAAAVAEICVRLDGLPLAIELAAARIKLFAPAALLARLSSRLALLTGGARDLPARQQTLRHTIAWSYDLLNEDEQTLFRRLGVFVGGCTLEAATEQGLRTEGRGQSEDALDSTLSPQSSVLDGLAALLDKSLLQQSTDRGEPRFTMLETIREYALEQLERSGETTASRQQHAAYFLALAEATEEPLRAASALHLVQLETEHDNLRAALTWARDSDDAEVFVRLAGALGRFWKMQGYHIEARVWLRHAVGQSNTVGTAARAKALYHAGGFVDSAYDPFTDPSEGRGC